MGPREVHLDRALVSESDAGRRVHRRRDLLLGRLPRLFGEREFVVARWEPRQSTARPEDTIDRWT
jgi:hypothetical protein